MRNTSTSQTATAVFFAPEYSLACGAMLVHHSVAGTACKQPCQRALTPARAYVVPSPASMSMRQAMTPQSTTISSPQRSFLASPALRPGRQHRRHAVQTRAFFDKIFKQDPSEKTRKQYQERVDAINALEPAMQALSDDQLRAKTQEFKQRVARGETLESLLPEAFAVSTIRGCIAAAHHCCPAHTSAAVNLQGHLRDTYSTKTSAVSCVCSTLVDSMCSQLLYVHLPGCSGLKIARVADCALQQQLLKSSRTQQYEST